MHRGFGSAVVAASGNGYEGQPTGCEDQTCGLTAFASCLEVWEKSFGKMDVGEVVGCEFGGYQFEIDGFRLGKID